MQLAFVLGVLGTCLGMMHAFKILGEAQVGDPSRLSAAISEVLWSTILGMGVALIGTVLICVALFGMRYRARWFFWCLILTGLIWLGTFPPLGLFFLIYGIMKRTEFTRSRDWTNLEAPGVA